MPVLRRVARVPARTHGAKIAPSKMRHHHCDSKARSARSWRERRFGRSNAEPAAASWLEAKKRRELERAEGQLARELMYLRAESRPPLLAVARNLHWAK